MYKKKQKQKEDMALLPLTKIRTPINLDAMALLPPIKNTHRAKWILNIGIPSKTMYYSLSLSLSLRIKKSGNCRMVDHQINSDFKSGSSWHFSGKYKLL